MHAIAKGMEHAWTAAVLGLNLPTSASREPKSFSICLAMFPLGGS